MYPSSSRHRSRERGLFRQGGDTTGAGDITQELESFRFLFLSAPRREEGRTAGVAEAYLLCRLFRGTGAKAEKAVGKRDKCRARACRGLR